jgi:hypothetical protein
MNRPPTNIFGADHVACSSLTTNNINLIRDHRQLRLTLIGVCEAGRAPHLPAALNM